jgi:hypothetical protein
LLFPSLCRPTGDVAPPKADLPVEYRTDRTAMMPRRRRTRAQNRAHRIAAERRQNRDTRIARRAQRPSYFGLAAPESDDDPPPF